MCIRGCAYAQIPTPLPHQPRGTRETITAGLRISGLPMCVWFFFQKDPSFFVPRCARTAETNRLPSVYFMFYSLFFFFWAVLEGPGNITSLPQLYTGANRSPCKFPFPLMSNERSECSYLYTRIYITFLYEFHLIFSTRFNAKRTVAALKIK